MPTRLRAALFLVPMLFACSQQGLEVETPSEPMPEVLPQDGIAKTSTQPIPERYAQLRAVTLATEDASVRVRLINPAAKPISFTGYGETSPWYRIQRWQNGSWVDHRVGWFCGTGMRQCVIAAGRSAVIPVHADESLFPIRVGVAYRVGGAKNGTEDQVVWSDRIERQ